MHLGVFIAITESTIRIDEWRAQSRPVALSPVGPESPMSRCTGARRSPSTIRARGSGTSRRSITARISRALHYTHGWCSRDAHTEAGRRICLLIQRDTIMTAKAVATLDQLSSGRVLFGIGGGWNAEQMEHHGTVFKTRFQKMGEQVRAMKAIWTQDIAEFHGAFVNFAPIRWAEPLQQPHPRCSWR